MILDKWHQTTDDSSNSQTTFMQHGAKIQKLSEQCWHNIVIEKT